MAIADAPRQAAPQPRQGDIAEGKWVRPAANDTVDVYLVRPTTGITDAALTWLDDADRTRLERMTHPRARAGFLLGRWLVRGVLGEAVGEAPETLRFVDNPWGRPELDPNAHPALSDVRFNLSHTFELAALAVSSGREVGVDVEHTERKSKTVAIADRFFAAPEVAQLHAMSSLAAQRDRFFDYWTLKESYIKARGMGLAIPLGAFWFSFGAAGPSVTTAPKLSDNDDRWRFHQWSPGPAHRAALCYEASDTAAPRICTSWCDPSQASPRLMPGQTSYGTHSG